MNENAWPRRTRRGLRGRATAWAAACVLAGGGLAGWGVAGAGQAAAQTISGCPVYGLGPGFETVYFCYTGGSQTWTVPAGVTSATFDLWGAEGGGNGSGSGTGGLGAEATGTLTVSPGDVLQVNVGQAGAIGTSDSSTASAFGGGGESGADAGGGGGATDVRVAASDGSYPLGNRVFIAGGGGGGGAAAEGTGGSGPTANGGNADSNGEPGASLNDAGSCGETVGGGGPGDAGSPAGDSAGGQAGTLSSPCSTAGRAANAGNSGTLGTGGDGGLYYGGGGGGGGYYGGGGGGGGASDTVGGTLIMGGGGSGGGGSSYTDPSATGTSVTDGVAAPDDSPDGEVAITYSLVTSIPVTVTGTQVYGSSAPQFTASYTASPGTVTGTVTCATVNGGTAIGPALTAGGSYTIDGSSCSGLTAASGYAISYTGGTFTVTQAPQTISFTPPATGLVGQSATLSATGGASGNPVTFTVDSSSGAGVCGVSGDTVSYSAPGSCVIDANQAGSTDYTAAATVRGTITVDQAPAFTADSPPLTAATGTPYSYQFTASGTPAPAFTLGGGAPSWLSVNSSTGLVSGTPPAGTKSFSYSVTASSSAGSVTAGPFAVTVSDKADIKAALSCPSGLTVASSGTCTLTVTNTGPALATSVVAGATAAAQLQVTGCSNACTRLGGVVAWKLGSLPSGQSATLTVSVTAARTGTAIVAAADGAANPDPNLLNNVAAATIKISKS